MTPTSSRPPPDPRADGPVPVAPRILDSRDLLAGRKEILIRHGAEEYRLRLTAQNKLILTK